MSKFRFWGAVAKDGSHIRAVKSADSLEMAEALLMENWTDRLKALYEIKPVTVAVDESAVAKESSH